MALDTSNLDVLFRETNLAEKLDEELLVKIGVQVVQDFEYDLESRKNWEDMYDSWMKLAIQVIEHRTWPWLNASNVKYPLLATSAMQFAARAYPTLVSGTNVVKVRVIGEDPDGQKQLRADRIGKHMSYQVLEEMDGWDEEMDRACFILPIVGCVFKKIYFDPTQGHNVSELVLPKDLVVNYWTKTLEDAPTKTHIMYMSKNKVKEFQLGGTYLDIDLKGAVAKTFDVETKGREHEGLNKPSNEQIAPLTVLEQHRFWDLDDDGYDEPYIITVEYSTKKVVRITPRFEKDKVKINGKKILKIEPEEYFLKFSFIPNPDGGFYDLGFGALLGPLNETVNTLINQLIDSGTIHNLQSGFIAKGVRLKAGDTDFRPGEWKFVQTSGDDLRKGIFPLPTKEPSETLFKLLGTIVESGEKLASVAEIFVGKMPGQNTPATTTMATIEQGMKVFTAIYKRIYRSLTKEFKRLYRLNQIYLPPQAEFQVLDSPELQQIGQNDYTESDTDVKPAADPTNVSEQLRLTKAQALLEMIPLGTVNALEATKRVLEAMEQPEIEKLLNNQPPPPDPKLLQVQAKMQADQQKASMDMQKSQVEMQMKQEMGKFDIQMKQMDMQMEAMKAQLEMHTAQQKAIVDTAVAKQDMALNQQKGQYDMAKQQQDMQFQEKAHAQKMEQSDAQHKQKLQQAKEKPVPKGAK